MSYELRKPITNKEQMDFIVRYNHNQGLRIEDTEMFLFALEDNEIMGEKEIEIDVPDFEIIEEEYEVPIYNEETGEIDHYETRTREVKVPIMIEIEVEVPDYDEEGNIIGYHMETQEVQQTHKETIIIPYPVINPDYEKEQAQKERERLDALYMTRSDFFDGMIMAFGLDSKELRVVIENILNSINITDVEIKVALNNYDNALNFYRKHTLFTLLNNVEIPINDEVTLIFTSDIWDKFFDTKDYKELQKAIKIVSEPVDVESEVE